MRSGGKSTLQTLQNRKKNKKYLLLWNYTFNWMANIRSKTMRCNRIWLWIWIIIIIIHIYIQATNRLFLLSISLSILFLLNKTSFHSFCRAFFCVFTSFGKCLGTFNSLWRIQYINKIRKPDVYATCWMLTKFKMYVKSVLISL